VLGADGAAADVVERPVPAFRDHRLEPRSPGGVAPEEVLDRRVVGLADARGVREHDGKAEKLGLLDPRHAGELAVAVQDEGGRGHEPIPDVLSRKNDRHSGAHGIPLDDAFVTDENPCDVGDGVQRTGRKDSDLDPELAGAFSILSPGSRGRQAQKKNQTSLQNTFSRATNSPLPRSTRSSPPSTTTRPRLNTVTGQPLTFRPSYGV